MVLHVAGEKHMGKVRRRGQSVKSQEYLRQFFAEDPATMPEEDIRFHMELTEDGDANVPMGVDLHVSVGDLGFCMTDPSSGPHRNHDGYSGVCQQMNTMPGRCLRR